jgi:hypothetical protein
MMSAVAWFAKPRTSKAAVRAVVRNMGITSELVGEV